MKTSLTFIVSIMTLSGFTQNLSDCDKNLKQTPHFISLSHPSSQQIKNDFEILQTCGGVDKVDWEIINGPIMHSLILEAGIGKPYTFSKIIPIVERFKETISYQQYREILLTQKELYPKPVLKSNWQQDKLLVLQLGLPEEKIKEIEKMVALPKFQGKTYQYLIDELWKIK